MSDTTLAGTAEGSTKGQVWVAFGQAGAVGSIHRTPNGYGVKLLNDAEFRGEYPTLDIAQSALHSSLLPGTDRPEFREH